MFRAILVMQQISSISIIKRSLLPALGKWRKEICEVQRKTANVLKPTTAEKHIGPIPHPPLNSKLVCCSGTQQILAIFRQLWTFFAYFLWFKPKKVRPPRRARFAKKRPQRRVHKNCKTQWPFCFFLRQGKKKAQAASAQIATAREIHPRPS